MAALQAGTVVTLKPDKEMPYGWFLTNGKDRVLLHKSGITDGFRPDEQVDVFIFQDRQGRLAATMIIPEIQIGRYGWAEVADVHRELGVFISIGIHKDILIAKGDLPPLMNVWPKKGGRLYCTLKTDRNGLLYAKLATEEVMKNLFVEASAKDFNKDVTGVVYRTLKSGTFVLTVEGYRGFIHESQRMEEPGLGETVHARIIDVKPDGSVNLSLLKRTHEAIEEDAAAILAYLQTRGGSMPYSDKSHPEDIQARFRMSKGAFKRAMGRLMKEGKIYQEEGWTYLKGSETRDQS